MALRRRRVVEPLRDGTFRLNLDSAARSLIVRLAAEMREVILRADPGNEAIRRLFPVAYHSDPDADAEYQRLMREELLTSRLSAIETLETVLRPDDETPPVLGESDVHMLMTSVNALRLMLGTMLDVGEDDDPGDPDDDEADHRQLYDYLSWLLEHLVQALADSL
jgi:hypothetical protein